MTANRIRTAETVSMAEKCECSHSRRNAEVTKLVTRNIEKSFRLCETAMTTRNQSTECKYIWKQNRDSMNWRSATKTIRFTQMRKIVTWRSLLDGTSELTLRKMSDVKTPKMTANTELSTLTTLRFDLSSPAFAHAWRKRRRWSVWQVSRCGIGLLLQKAAGANLLYRNKIIACALAYVRSSNSEMSDLRTISEKLAAFDFDQLKRAWNDEIVVCLRELEPNIEWPEITVLEKLHRADFEDTVQRVSSLFAVYQNKHDALTAIPVSVRLEAYTHKKVKRVAVALFERLEFYDKRKEFLLEMQRTFFREKTELIESFRRSLPSPRNSRSDSKSKQQQQQQRPRMPPFTPRTQAAVDLLAMEFEMFLLNYSINQMQLRMRDCVAQMTSIIALLLEIQKTVVANFKKREEALVLEYNNLSATELWLVPLLQCFVKAITPYVCSSNSKNN